MLFLLVFAVLLYFTKKKVWAAVKEHPELLEGQRAPTEYKGRSIAVMDTLRAIGPALPGILLRF